MPYAEAMARYGSDKPDLRCGMELQDLSEPFAGSGFSVVPRRDRGRRRSARVRRAGGARYSRKRARRAGRAGEAARRRRAGVGAARPTAACRAPALKAAGEDAIRARAGAAGAGPADLLLMAAGRTQPTAADARAVAAATSRRRENLLDPNRYEFLWVVDFPMFEWLEEEKRWEFMHHPFTAPLEADADRLETDPGSVRARAYDLVLNGSEIGGGSIRIHDQTLQRLDLQAARDVATRRPRLRFGFFVDALEFGTPPHGGIALGLDRIVAILAGEQSIREVIAFPKTAQAVDLMAGAPSTVDPKQLRELKLRVEP